MLGAIVLRIRTQHEKWSVVGHALDGSPLLRPSFAEPEIYVCSQAELDSFLAGILRFYAVAAVFLLSLLAAFTGNTKLGLTFPIMCDFLFLYAAFDKVSQHRALKLLSVVNPEERNRFHQTNFWKRFASIVFDVTMIIFALLLYALMYWSKTGIFDADGNIIPVRLFVVSPLFFLPVLFASGIWVKLR